MQSRGNFCALWALLFAFTTSRAQQWDWVQRLSSESYGTAIGVDGNQNVYVAGNFRGTNFFGTNRLASAGGLDVFLAKLNRGGEVIWAISAGGPGDDSIGRLAVAANGALFVVGNFTIPASLLGQSANDHSQDVSNVFVARVDDGRFTWFETLPAETGGIGGGVAFAPGESVWVVGATNRVFFFKKYAQSGAVLSSFTMSNYSQPTGLAVNRDEQLFVSDFYSVSRVDFTGERQWQWSPGDGYPERNIVSDIKCTPQGDVLSLGTVNSGFRHGANLVQHTPDGTVVRQNIQWGSSHKSIFRGNGLAVDPLGDIYVTGLAVGHYLGPSPGDGLWVASYDSNAVLTSGTTVGNRRYSYPWNVGTAIAVASDGANYITGNLTGSSFFGVNEYDGGGAFVARRSFDRTNQIPILRAPKLRSAYSPSMGFTALNHTNIVFAGDSISFNAVFVDLDNERLTYRWIDSNTGMPVAADTQVTHFDPSVYNYELFPSGDYVSVLSGPETFAVGIHAVEVIASDGLFSTTNRWAFEVIEREMLVQGFLTTLNALGSERAGARAIALWEAYLRAKEKGREHLAANRWKSFNRQLQRVTSLSEEERAQLGYAASVVQALLLAE